MEVKDIPVDLLIVSESNVRKTLSSQEDEANITDLSNDIATNGLLNPLTVRYSHGKYEVIAGQRRLMAMRLLNKKTIPCNIIDVNTQKAEELSLIENVQRNQMTSCDKVRAYSRLYEVYSKDVNKVASVVHITKSTIQKYLKISSLPEEIIERLDKTGDDKITIEVAEELSKLDCNKKEMLKICNSIKTLNTIGKINAIKRYIQNESDDIEDIVDEVAIEQNNIKLAPSVPYVIDENKEYIIIPPKLYPAVVKLIKEE